MEITINTKLIGFFVGLAVFIPALNAFVQATANFIRSAAL